MMDNLVLLETPELKRPCLIAAFAGWPDAAEVASRSVNYLRHKLEAKRFAELSPEEFFDFAQCRPMVVAEEGALRRLRPPSNDLYYWKNQAGEHDLILLQGTEPQLKWKTFADTLIRFAVQFGVVRILALGGLYDNVPHTRQPKVTGLVNAVALRGMLQDHGIGLVNYQGPSSIHSVLLAACSRARVEMLSLWGHAPFYVRSEANPKVCLALITVLNRLLGVTVGLEDLEGAAEQMDSMLERLMAENQHLRSHVRKLEEQHDAAIAPEGLPEGTDQIIRDVEEFLRREGGGSY
ncbi:MAG: PAC2 family protein [Chloroflexota bacterium]